MKKTLFFSNVIGNIMEYDLSIRFNDYMTDYLLKNIDNDYSMIYIDAPGLGGEEYYLPNILKCFNKIDIKFKNVFDLGDNVTKKDLEQFINENNKIVYFLMGGDPYAQMRIIDEFDLRDTIKNHNDLVIGFCAGAINLSKFSIITTDEDFDEADSYIGIERESICIEPHYNNPNDDKRNKELKEFSNKYKTKIYCIPDQSIIYFEDGKRYEVGQIYNIQ